MDIKEKIDEKRQQLSYKVQAKIKEYLHIQGIGRRTNGITEELTFRVMDVFTMSLWNEIFPLIEPGIQSRFASMTPEKRIAELVAVYEGWNKNVVKRSEDYEDYIELSRQIITLCSPSPDKVREILIRHFEPVDVDEKVDFAYSLTTCVNEICGGIE